MNEVKLLNIGGIDQNVKDQYARDIIAPSENGLDSTSNLPVASRHYDVGEFLIGQDRLYYEALVEINVGDTLVVNSNIKATTVSDELVNLRSKSADAAIECIADMESTNLSVKAYEVGDYLYWQHGLDSGLYKVIADIAIGDALVINTNIKVSEPLANAVTELTRINNDFGVKNLLLNEANSFEAYGVNFTVNPDGSVTLNGTATEDYFYRLFIRNFKLPNGRYILSGCPSGGSEETYKLSITNGASVVINEYGNGAEFDADGITFTQCYIKVIQGQMYTDLTFKPMIRPAYITDDTYEPYARSNQELTGEVESMLNILGAKNLLPNNAVTQTKNGITFTVNEDGSVTARGTNQTSGLANIDLWNVKPHLFSQKGKYILTGCPKADGSNKYRIQLYNLATSVAYNDYGNGVQFEVTEINNDNWTVQLTVFPGSSINATFYPMIRPASIKDDTYVPYAKTNREITKVMPPRFKMLKSYSVTSPTTSIAFDMEKYSLFEFVFYADSISSATRRSAIFSIYDVSFAARLPIYGQNDYFRPISYQNGVLTFQSGINIIPIEIIGLV